MEFGNIEDVGSIRIKIFEPCNWSCKFCHNEGNLIAQPVAWDNELKEILGELKNKCGINEVHLTGGEPTLSPHLVGLINGCKGEHLTTKLTTNGQFSSSVRNDIIGTQIDAMSVSLHSVNSQDLIPMMKKKVDADWAQKQINRSKENIVELIKAGIKVRVNSVISDREDIKRIMNVFRFTAQYGVEMRVLDDLSRKEDAASAISEMIISHNAKLLTTKKEPGTSSSRSVYCFPELGTMVIKKIEKIFLEDICKNCPHLGKNSCQEGFYSIRLQKKQGIWLVLLCIQNKTEETIMPLSEFLIRYGKG